MALRIDHVTIASSRLEAVAGAFAGAGLATEYGGQHSNGATHMSLLGFDDGSYIELVSVVRPGLQAPRWQAHIAYDVGPCSWAVVVEDVAAEAERLRRAGVPVDGPHALSRKRPDGELVEWELAYVGEEGPGALHPFLINDRTLHETRVAPSADLAGSGLTGVDSVVLGVAGAAEARSVVERVYGARGRDAGPSEALDAHLVRFDDVPLILASPGADDGWLARRLSLVGPSPCAMLIRSDDLGASRERFALSPPVDWDGRALCWFDSDAMWPLRVGVVQG